MATPEMTLAERVERTREIYAEIADLWGDEMPSVTVHRRDHQEIHDCGFPASATFSNDAWGISASLGKYPFSPMLFGLADHECRACVDLVMKRGRAVEAQQAVTVGAAS